MFDSKDNDMAQTLSLMQREALQRCNFHQGDAAERMREWIKQDRRLDAYDPGKLIERVNLCRSNGAVLDLSDPGLKRGGEPRPGGIMGRSGRV